MTDINNIDELENNKQQEALAKQVEEFWEEFTVLLEKHKIIQHAAIFIHPAAGGPLIHFNPNEYEAAKMTKSALDQFRQLILNNIS